jgi:integrase
MLHSVFKRAVRDRVILNNPARETELPKVVPHRLRILTPAEFSRLLDELPTRYVAMVLTDIETGLRWGELTDRRDRDRVPARLLHQKSHPRPTSPSSESTASCSPSSPST